VARSELALLLNNLHVVDVNVLAITLLLPILRLYPLLRKSGVFIDAVVGTPWQVDSIAAHVSLIVTLGARITAFGFSALQDAIG